MKELVAYAGRCWGPDGRRGAPIAAFESVQGAYTEGRPLMQALRQKIEDDTGERYLLTHVKMSGASIGAAQFRKRYFPVFHRVPFGVDRPDESLLPDGRIVTYRDAIGDLAGAKLQWEDQRYPKKPKSTFAAVRRREDGRFSDHMPLDYRAKASVIDEVDRLGWLPGEGLQHACIRHGFRPPAFEKSYLPDENKYKGFNWPRRVNPDRCGYVLTGSSGQFIHWEEARSLTVRECSRLMGYPDNWVWPTDRHKIGAAWVGKCCPVDSGRWMSSWIRRSLEGRPGTDQVELGYREYFHDSTNVYKRYSGADVPPLKRP
jgi:site-specific DNA-cytosine methylase